MWNFALELVFMTFNILGLFYLSILVYRKFNEPVREVIKHIDLSWEVADFPVMVSPLETPEKWQESQSYKTLLSLMAFLEQIDAPHPGLPDYPSYSAQREWQELIRAIRTPGAKTVGNIKTYISAQNN